MDYKKEYEAMVQRARELHKGGNALTKQQMEIVCPELAESEDARVNEEIRNFLIDMECKREWIAYLEKQKEQKSAEWSEEDRKMLNTIISDGSRGVELDAKQVNWLKSLCPQYRWKPSEEQLEALWNTLHPDDPYYVDLSSLYNDLKKL